MADETPLLKQYRAVKAEHPDAILMYRIGDFFEMFERDAEIAARELELTLTSKPMGKAGRLPLAGVPHHAVESYIARLIRKGYHVALCDQTEDPKKAKGLVKREVVRIITPGTYSSSDGRENKFIAAFNFVSDDTSKKHKKYSLAICDLLTGEMYYGIYDTLDEINSAFAGFRTSEILIPDSNRSIDNQSIDDFLLSFGFETHITKLPSWRFGASHGEEVLKNHFGVETLIAFELDENALSALGALFSYLIETQKSSLKHIAVLTRIGLNDTVKIDAATLLQLEILDSPSRDTEATLLSSMDKAVTAMGSRLIARRIAAPIRDAVEIRKRLDAVEAFFSDSIMRAEMRTLLKKVYDLERLSGKVALGRITPHEVVALASSLEAIPAIINAADHPALEDIKNDVDPIPELIELIRKKLVENPPLDIGEGPLFRDGVNSLLDELRYGSRESRQWIAGLQERERARTGISSLKVGFNNVFGYFIEVTKANLDKVPSNYIRKQTMTSAERYYTEELKHHEEIVLGAKEKITELEIELFNRLREEILIFLPRIQKTAHKIAVFDLSAAFAQAAADRHYTKPDVIESDEPFIRIEGGRHPVVEALLSAESSFVPNDTLMDSKNRFMILTGPNMAGKSTFIRQTAVISLMAQAGSFVPAARCVISPFDGIYARIGASDRLARGLSTFMVEMIEAAMILRNATKKSLVILDEIGRGTSTFDGLAIAWAIVEALSSRGCISLFATHYHELTALAEEIDGVFNCTVSVKEWGDKIHFLHAIRNGAADRSYGIQVAALAGVPKHVLERAKNILSSLEDGDMKRHSSESDQLSLFYSSTEPNETNSSEKTVLDELFELEPDSISPREALDLISKWKESLKS